MRIKMMSLEEATYVPPPKVPQPKKARGRRGERLTDGSTFVTMLCEFEKVERTFRVSAEGTSICRHCLENGPKVETQS